MLQTFCSLFLLEKSSFIIKTKHRFHLPKKLKAVRNFRSYKKPLHLDKNLHSLNKKNSMSSAMANLFLPHQVYLTSINHQNVIITFLVNLEHGDEDKKWRIILFLWVTGKDGLSRGFIHARLRQKEVFTESLSGKNYLWKFVSRETEFQVCWW